MMYLFRTAVPVLSLIMAGGSMVVLLACLEGMTHAAMVHRSLYYLLMVVPCLVLPWLLLRRVRRRVKQGQGPHDIG